MDHGPWTTDNRKMGFKFENLEIWKEAVELSAKVYQVTAGFPKEEIFGLTNQLRRAAVSVALNIAEGSTGRTDKDFRLYLLRSIGSVHELVTGFYIALEQKYMEKEVFDAIYGSYDILGRRISSLIKTINKPSTVDGRPRSK